MTNSFYRGVRSKNLFNPSSKEPFRLSRSKIETFLKCPRCFYLDRRLGVGQPPGFPFTLNSAVDALLKKEFDIHRSNSSQHPLMEKYNIKAIPFSHPKIDQWRENFVGVEYYHQPSNFIVFGAVDDIWVNDQNELMVVDYKSTSKDGETNIDAEWQKSYKNQMEIYQWLLRNNGFKVSNIGYFVYANGKKDKKAFDGVLEFDVNIIPYEGDDSWVEDVIITAKECLNSPHLPPWTNDCDYCIYRQSAIKAEGDQNNLIL